VPALKCQEAQSAIHSILDDDAEESLRERFNHHIDSCAICEEYMEGLHITINKVKELDWLEAPDTILTNVMSQISELNHGKRIWLRTSFVKWGSFAAVLLVMVFVGGVYWGQPDRFSVMTSSRNGNLAISKNAVIVPTGSEYRGDLTISNGDIIVHGKVDGDVTALNGRVILASGADIKGRTQEVHEFWQWVRYYSWKMWNTIVKWF
jgi:hypothetical protein